MIDLHLSAFAPRWRFLYVVRIDAYKAAAPALGQPEWVAEKRIVAAKEGAETFGGLSSF